MYDLIQLTNFAASVKTTYSPKLQVFIIGSANAAETIPRNIHFLLRMNVIPPPESPLQGPVPSRPPAQNVLFDATK